MRRFINILAALALLATGYGLGTIARFDTASAFQGQCRTFAETGKQVCGRFLEYWQANGGLAQQGLPLSGEFTEVNELDGKPYTVQYFERAVFEKHPENARPFDVLLSQLGTFQFQRKYPGGDPSTGQPPPTQEPPPGPAIPIGQTGEAGDFRVTVNSVRYTTQGVVDPDQGNEYLIVNMTVQNISSDAKAFSSLLFLTLLDNQGREYDISLFGPDIEIIETTIRNANPEGRVRPGQAITGEVAFEVAKSARGLVLVYESLFPEGRVEFKLDR